VNLSELARFHHRVFTIDLTIPHRETGTIVLAIYKKGAIHVSTARHVFMPLKTSPGNTMVF
jgi:hypothetical protein